MKQRGLHTLIAACLLLAAGLAPAPAAQSLTDVQAKLVIIHNFISEYIRWPGRYSLDDTRQIYICAQGEDELTTALPLLERASTETLKVNVVQDPSEAELTICHVMVFAATEKRNFRQQMAKMKEFPVLTISNMKHFLDKGGMVALETEVVHQGNFEQRFVRYSVNTGALSRAGLVIEPDAIELANRVLP